MYRQCTEQAPASLASCASSSPCHYYFAEPEASNCHDLVRQLSYQDNRQEINDFRGDAPPKKTRVSGLGIDDSGRLYESTVGSQGYYTGSTADYSSHSYRSKIATFSSGISEAYIKPSRADFKGEADAEADKLPNVDKYLEPNREQVRRLSNTSGYQNQVVATVGLSQSWKSQLQVTKHDKVIKPDDYRKATYAVLIGDTVRVCNTKLYASLPLHNKYMVKERIKDAFGNTRVKMSLKVFQSSSSDEPRTSLYDDNDELETDGDGTKHYYHKNSQSPGFIIFTRDKRFHGNMRYPLPAEKATIARIGKGGNGFVFTLYHEKKQYAVKKTIYRSNEVNVHSALNHKNILPLAAVLIGERHEKHSGKFYCFHFMSKMDYDLRQILSAKEIGCLRHYYVHCSKVPDKFGTAYNNIKYILMATLKGLEYLHSQGYVHRDVKASNIMIKMKNCKGNPLQCNCSTKFEVKLGDFDSAGTVPGLGIKEPTDQLIKFASILPLGTPGYRAPEVSMHVTLSGPYETLYTTAVDIWSFGCLCLNICIGKTAALRQREEASLLLSESHYCATELWEKTTKISELQKTRPFNTDNRLLALVRSCLQVNSKKRPTASQAQQYIIL